MYPSTKLHDLTFQKTLIFLHLHLPSTVLSYFHSSFMTPFVLSSKLHAFLSPLLIRYLCPFSTLSQSNHGKRLGAFSCLSVRLHESQRLPHPDFREISFLTLLLNFSIHSLCGKNGEKAIDILHIDPRIFTISRYDWSL